MKKLGLSKKKIALPTRGKIYPSLVSLLGEFPAEPTPNPLDTVDYPNTLQGDAEIEVSAALAAILAERKQKRDAFRLMADAEYWLCLCFQSRQQKEEFLRLVGWDAVEGKYVDGLDVAQSLGIEIEPIELPARKGTTRIPRLLRGKKVIIHEKAD